MMGSSDASVAVWGSVEGAGVKVGGGMACGASTIAHAIMVPSLNPTSGIICRIIKSH